MPGQQQSPVCKTPVDASVAGGLRRQQLCLTLAVVLTAGCTSLPRYVPDLMRHDAPINLAGSRGLLSDERSRAILARLDRAGVASDIFQRHLALEEAIAGYPLTTGNKVVLLQDGPATYKAMLSTIAAARDHINMETYILDDDEVGQRFVKALTARQVKAVQVNLLRDGLGTLATPPALFAPLVASGGLALGFPPLHPLVARQAWELG